MTRRLRGLVQLAIIALAAFLCGERPASAQVPAPKVFSWSYSLDEVARAGVRLPRDAVIAALVEYERGYEAAAARAVEDGLGLAPSMQSGTTPGDNAGPPVEIMRRVQELDNRVAETELRLLNQLFDAFAAVASESDRPVLDAMRQREVLRMCGDRMMGMISGGSSFVPDDIAGWLTDSRKAPPSPEERRARLLLSAQNAPARIAALNAVRKQRLAIELERAGKAPSPADESSPEGRDGYWNGGRWRPTPIARGVGEQMRRTLVKAQLDTYALIRPSLSPDAAAAIAEYWLPRMVGIHEAPDGLPALYTGSHRVGVFVTEFLRCKGLDDAARAQVREIGRAWVRDDEALIARSMERLIATGTPEDIESARAERAARARKDFAKIPALAWLSNPDATIPEAQDPVDPADAKEFGVSFASESEVNPGDGEEGAVAPGLPAGFARATEAALGDMLRLDDAQRVVMRAIFDDARVRWREQVYPLARAGSPDPRGMVAMRPVDHAAIDARLARAKARREAWAAADALDAQTMESLAAALGEGFDRRAIALVAASRVAGCMSGRSIYSSTTVPYDVAACILETPMAPESRTAAIAAAEPLLAAWVASLRTDREQGIRVEEIDASAQRVIADQPPWRDGSGKVMIVSHQPPELNAARAERDQMDRACDEAAKKVADAALAAIPEPDQRRLRAVIRAAAHPEQFGNPRELFARYERAIACLPADRRDAVREATEPILVEFDERFARVAKVLDKLPPPARRSGYETFIDLRMAIGSAAARTASLAAIQLMRHFSLECWTFGESPATSRGVAFILARLAGELGDPASPAPTAK